LQVEAAGAAAPVTAGGQPLQLTPGSRIKLTPGSRIKLTVPFKAAVEDGGVLLPVRKFSSAKARDMM
jgi:hypothetical protein